MSKSPLRSRSFTFQKSLTRIAVATTCLVLAMFTRLPATADTMATVKERGSMRVGVTQAPP